MAAFKDSSGSPPGTLKPRSWRWWSRFRRLRTPFFPQSHAAECGAACLGIVLAHFGRWVPLSELRRTCGVSRDGCSAADIARAAEHYGLRARGWRREPEQLRRMALPVILFWEFHHFVVLEGFGASSYRINDPGAGHRTIGREAFRRRFTGVALALEPGPDFIRGGARPGILRQLWRWLRGQPGLLALAIGAGLLLVLPTLALPMLLGSFVDRAMAANGGGTGAMLIAATAGLGVLCLGLTWLQQRCLRLIGLRVSVSRAASLVARLLRLPIDYFLHRNAGDLVARTQSVDRIAASASGHFTGMAIELVMSAFMLAFMIHQDPVLAAVVLGLALGGGVATRVISRLRLNENHQVRREQLQLTSVGMFALRNLDALRASGAEGHFFTRFTGFQARELSARQRFAELGALTASLSPALLMLGSAAVIGVGGLRVIGGHLTLGELMALYVVAASFLRPVTRFIELSDLFQMLEADLQRLEDVVQTEQDPVVEAQAEAGSGGVATLDGKLRLAGRLELAGVGFGYKAGRRSTIDDVDLVIEPGQRVAIVGRSGSGKSTLARVVAGIHPPWRGEILFDGRPRVEIPRAVMMDSVAYVDQHVALFAATVAENLTMWDATVPDGQVVQAAMDAAIHDEIATRPMGYQGSVEEGGRNFSGGQRQRLEIARALVNNPSLLILDEATSALDVLAEERIFDAVRRRGCACLIVTHRLSAIRDCDEIVVMHKGRIVQRGRHEDLLAERDGPYLQIVGTE